MRRMAIGNDEVKERVKEMERKSERERERGQRLKRRRGTGIQSGRHVTGKEGDVASNSGLVIKQVY